MTDYKIEKRSFDNGRKDVTEQNLKFKKESYALFKLKIGRGQCIEVEFGKEKKENFLKDHSLHKWQEFDRQKYKRIKRSAISCQMKAMTKCEVS